MSRYLAFALLLSSNILPTAVWACDVYDLKASPCSLPQLESAYDRISHLTVKSPEDLKAERDIFAAIDGLRRVEKLPGGEDSEYVGSSGSDGAGSAN